MNLDPGCFTWLEADDGPRPNDSIKTERISPYEAECAAELKRLTGQGDGYCRDSAREFLILYRFIIQQKGWGQTEASAPLSERARVVSILRDMIAARCRRLGVLAKEYIEGQALAIAALQDALDLIDPPSKMEAEHDRA